MSLSWFFDFGTVLNKTPGRLLKALADVFRDFELFCQAYPIKNEVPSLEAGIL